MKLNRIFIHWYPTLLLSSASLDDFILVGSIANEADRCVPDYGADQDGAEYYRLPLGIEFVEHKRVANKRHQHRAYDGSSDTPSAIRSTAATKKGSNKQILLYFLPPAHASL